MHTGLYSGESIWSDIPLSLANHHATARCRNTPKYNELLSIAEFMTVSNRIEQSIEQCQHPGEGTHIHAVEQIRPQGMKTQRTKQRNTSQQKPQESFT